MNALVHAFVQPSAFLSTKSWSIIQSIHPSCHTLLFSNNQSKTLSPILSIQRKHLSFVKQSMENIICWSIGAASNPFITLKRANENVLAIIQVY